MKKTLLFILLCITTVANATVYTIAAGGGNWNSNSTWSPSTGFPASSDTVKATGSSGALTVNVASACKLLDFTGYTNTLTMSNTITCGGSVTLASGMTITGINDLRLGANCTIKSNGKIFSGGMQLINGAITVTLADDWTILGTLTKTITTGDGILNGNTLTIGGGLTVSNRILGTTNLIMNGTGTWTSNTNCNLGCNLTFNTIGTITISGTVFLGTSTSITLTYIAGIIITTGSTLQLGRTHVLNTGGMTWNNVSMVNQNGFGTSTTLNSDLNIAGNLVCFGSIFNGAFNVNVGGNVTTDPTFNTTGTATIIMNGTGTWSGHGSISNNLKFNTSGTITISNAVFFKTGTLTYTAGTIITSGDTLSILGSCTLNTSGIIWNNIAITGSTTITLASDFKFAGTLTNASTSSFAGSHSVISTGNSTHTLSALLTFKKLNLQGNTTFAGTSGFTTDTLTCATAGTTQTLVSTKTYTVNKLLTITGTLASPISFLATTGGSKAIVTVGSASNDVSFCNAADIGSSLGYTVWDYKGTLSNTSNWNLLTPPVTRGYLFVN